MIATEESSPRLGNSASPNAMHLQTLETAASINTSDGQLENFLLETPQIIQKLEQDSGLAKSASTKVVSVSSTSPEIDKCSRDIS